MQESEASHLIQLIQHTLDDSNDFPAHHLRLRLTKTIQSLQRVNASIDLQGEKRCVDTNTFGDDVFQEIDAMGVHLIQDEKAVPATAFFRDESRTIEIFYASNQIPSVSSSSSVLATFVATQLQSMFEEEQAVIAQILTTSATGPGAGSQLLQTPQTQTPTVRDLRQRSNLALRPEIAHRLASRLTRTLKYSPTYHITISLFSPTADPSSWEIKDAIAEYLTPLLAPISRISNFSVDSQIQLHASFSPSVNPIYDEEHGLWTLREDDLSNFINAAEWPLSPSIAAGPTLNFIVYVPDPSNTPLAISENHATSWLIPQWGGVFILNQHSVANTTTIVTELSKESIRPAILTFAHQMLSFLGAPQSPQSFHLQIQTLTRIQAASLLLSASSTLGSLARLTKALPTIAIPETVSEAVDITLAELRKTCDNLKEGNFNEALSHARTAEYQAEKGFFEKSMVGQVYFPDEHKVAVYLPLLGPIGVPLLMSAVKELKRLSNHWKFRRQTA